MKEFLYLYIKQTSVYLFIISWNDLSQRLCNIQEKTYS